MSLLYLTSTEIHQILLKKKLTFQRVVQKINRESKKHILRKFAKPKPYKAFDNHYIFADLRGGSTWMMEIIQKITQEPVIWEPLEPKIKNNPFNAINFGWKQYIPENESWQEAKILFEKLFSGRILNENILDYSSFSQLRNSESLLFKICRGNALLPWLTDNFQFKAKPIYLIRHPFAVVNSQLKHGAWDYAFDGFHFPDTPYNDNYLEHKTFLETIKHKEEALVAEWCISNKIPLNHPKNNKSWITLNYEQFVMSPKETIEKILSIWELEHDLSKINFRKDSLTTKRDTPKSIEKRLSQWQNTLSATQLKNMERVLDYFEVDVYSKHNPLPKITFNKN